MIAQLNIARAIAALDSHIMADFMNNLDRINSLAEGSDGFIWRLSSEGSGNATDIKLFDDPLVIVNLSVWRDVQSLHRFVYTSQHKEFVTRRHEWFEATEVPAFCLWELADTDPMPSPQQAYDRLAHLRQHGPTATAFDWRSASGFIASP